MIRNKQAALTAVALALAGWGLVEACGLDFPHLLGQRHAEMKAPIPFRLAEELAALELPPLDDARTATELAKAARAQAQLATFEREPDAVEKRQTEAREQPLTDAQRKQEATMRAAADGDAAYALGDGLPPALRLYAAAAVDFHHGERAEPARARFEQILALPEAEAKPRAVWAAYSLGRLLSGSDAEAAGKAFAQARAWAARGAPDPLGLALDSYGEEAAVLLGRRTGDADGENGDGESEGEPARPRVGVAADLDTTERALHLYFEQARLGYWPGVESLQLLDSEALFDDDALTARLLASDWGQALLLRLALGDGGDAGTKRRYARLVKGIEALGPKGMREAERWAALAWQRDDLAHMRDWLARAPADTALGHWLRAKLALAGGKGDEAIAHFGKALELMRADAPASARDRLALELALHQVQRGDFVQGLQHLYRAGPDHWNDIAYLADRVLTLDELRSTTDGLVKADAKHVLAPRLQHLLARRLMRAGRFAEAGPYFPTAYEDTVWTGNEPVKRTTDLRRKAGDYASAVASADKAWTRVGHAGELMNAGQLARDWGLELMGFELDADAFAMGGSYDLEGATGQADGALAPGEDKRQQSSLQTLKLAGSHAEGLPRFHYRYVAAEHALQAAALVPPRSQAFAASLCHAAQWVGVRDEGFQREVYRRYVREGARVDWAPDFGHDCPAPSWFGAARMQAGQSLREQAPWLHRHPLRSAGGAALLAAAAVTAVVMRRRRRAV